MATFGNLIDRTLREWLSPADSQPLATTISAAMTDSATTLSYNGALLSAEEEDLLGPGTVVEVGTELIRVGAVEAASDNLTGLKRGYQGTTAAAHSSGDELTIGPVFPRQVVWDALADAIAGLYPTLAWYKTSAAITTPTSGLHTPTETDIEQPVRFTYQKAGNYGTGAAQLINYGGDKLIFPGVPGGAVGYLLYRARFPRPTAEVQDLETDLGLELSWQQLLMVSAVAYLVAHGDVDVSHVEFLTQQLAVQGYPPRTATAIQRSLLQYRETLLQQARGQQLATHPMAIIQHGAATGW